MVRSWIQSPRWLNTLFGRFRSAFAAVGVPKKLDLIGATGRRPRKLVRALLVAALAGAATDLPKKFPASSPVIRWAIQGHSGHRK
jgi:hypothetical protein